MIGLSDSDPDPRIVLVTITEQDIQTLGSWPLSDDVLAQVLESVARFGPRATVSTFVVTFKYLQGAKDWMVYCEITGRILIGEATLCRLGNRFVAEKVGQVSLKGKEESILRVSYSVVAHVAEKAENCKLSQQRVAHG